MTDYLKINGDSITPYSINQLLRDNPNVSFPRAITDEVLAQFGVTKVNPRTPPDHDYSKEKVAETLPQRDADTGCWTQCWIVVPLTADEIAQRHADKATEVRAERDRLLADSDWIAVSSYERGQAVPQAWADYRQALRDVTAQPGFPWVVEWPDLPA